MFDILRRLLGGKTDAPASDVSAVAVVTIKAEMIAPQVDKNAPPSSSRQATAAAADGNFEAAIAHLREEFKGGWQDIRNRCRVARFMQQSGQYDACIAEFAAIFNEVDGEVSRQFSHQPKRVRLGLAAHFYSDLCDQARISCKRQKDDARVAGFSELRDSWRAFAMRVQGRDLGDLGGRAVEDARSLANYPTDNDALCEAGVLAKQTERVLSGTYDT